MPLQLEDYEPALRAGTARRIAVTHVTTGTADNISLASLTTGIGINANDANALSTGFMVNLVSNSTSGSTRSLVRIVQDAAAATGARAFEIQQDSSAAAILVSGTSGGLVLSALATGSTGIVIEAPLTTDTPVTITGRTTANTSWMRIRVPSSGLAAGTIRYIQIYD